MGLLITNQLLKQTSKGHVIIGFSSGKDVELITSILPPSFLYYLCGSSNERVLIPQDYSHFFDQHKLKYQIFDFSFLAYDYCMLKSVRNDIILVTGSTFIVSDILKYLDKV